MVRRRSLLFLPLVTTVPYPALVGQLKIADFLRYERVKNA
jgi:hypothetical protein